MPEARWEEARPRLLRDAQGRASLELDEVERMFRYIMDIWYHILIH